MAGTEKRSIEGLTLCLLTHVLSCVLTALPYSPLPQHSGPRPCQLPSNVIILTVKSGTVAILTFSLGSHTNLTKPVPNWSVQVAGLAYTQRKGNRPYFSTPPHPHRLSPSNIYHLRSTWPEFQFVMGPPAVGLSEEPSAPQPSRD